MSLASLVVGVRMARLLWPRTAFIPSPSLPLVTMMPWLVSMGLRLSSFLSWSLDLTCFWLRNIMIFLAFFKSSTPTSLLLLEMPSLHPIMSLAMMAVTAVRQSE